MTGELTYPLSKSKRIEIIAYNEEIGDKEHRKMSDKGLKRSDMKNNLLLSFYYALSGMVLGVIIGTIYIVTTSTEVSPNIVLLFGLIGFLGSGISGFIKGLVKPQSITSTLDEMDKEYSTK